MRKIEVTMVLVIDDDHIEVSSCEDRGDIREWPITKVVELPQATI